MDGETDEHNKCSFPHAFVCSLLQRKKMDLHKLTKEKEGYAGQEGFFFSVVVSTAEVF